MAGLDAGVWWRIGWLSFGGPAGQIALMQRMLVEELRWIELPRFLAALNFCMLLPGPEAQQLATYIGWRRAGWRGAIVAGGLFVLPGMMVMLALSVAYVTSGNLPWIAALMLGVKCAVVVIVVEALLRVARHALAFPRAIWVAAGAFAAVHALAVPFPAMVAIAALLGAWAGLRSPSVAPVASESTGTRNATPWRLAAVMALAWLAPLALLLLLRGSSDFLSRLGLMYSELAVVTFGGAYAVLSHVAERAVATQGWLSAGQMADGLGLAETTPGPLILVLQFVAFVAAFQSGASASPLVFAIWASVLAVWFLFVPSFLWIFLGAPHLERLTADPRLRSALAFVTAAVVGVIAHLSIWFAAHVLFSHVAWVDYGFARVLEPEWATLDSNALVLVGVAALLLFGMRQGLLRTMFITAALALGMALFQGKAIPVDANSAALAMPFAQ